MRAHVAATLLAVVSLSFAERSAHADEKQACLAASEKAQQLRSAGKLGEAREQLNVCGRTECPKLVQQDCTQWMTELLASLPSIVPSAKDRNGRDVVDVRLTIDGKLATTVLDGKPIAVDPGVHTFVYEAAHAPAVKEQVVVRSGEKNRIVTVTFATPEDATAPAGPGAGAHEAPVSSSPPVLAYVLGGAGIVALGAALVVDLTATGDAHDLRNGCAPGCAQSDVDAVSTKYTIAGVTAGIGGALLVTGVVLLFMHGGERSRTATGVLHPYVSF